MVLASFTPNIVGHLKTNDDDALPDLPGALTKRMSAPVLVEITVLVRVPIRRVPLVGSLAFSL